MNETIPQYIERIRDTDAKVLLGYASHAHASGNYKLNRAIHALIREKKATIGDTIFNDYLAQLRADKERRVAAAAAAAAAKPANPNAGKEEKAKLLREMMTEFQSVHMDADKKRQIVIKQVYAKATDDPAYESYLSKKESNVAEIKALLADQDRIIGRNNKLENVGIMFEYIMTDGRELVALHSKFRDVIALKILEFKGREPREADVLGFDDMLVKAIAFILEEVPKSPLYVPSQWEIQLDGEPDFTTENEKERELHTEFAVLRKDYNHIFAEAQAYEAVTNP